MDFKQLSDFLKENSQPEYRLQQICRHYFSSHLENFSGMSDLPLSLRQKLDNELTLYSVKPVDTIQDGVTTKVLFELKDNHRIESVMMDYGQWISVCISSQVGCPLGCRFCATGKIGFIRNLTAEEMVDQIIYWNRILYPKFVGRIVVMGMGEPFLNWDNLIEGLKIINSENGLNIGARKISVSTAGVADRIKQFADLDTEINLAVSLHSADQKIRETIMPIAKNYSLNELTAACKYYASTTKRQIFFEYALMKDVNDSPDSIGKLAEFIRLDKLFYLNLIPLNPIKGGIEPSSRETIREISQYLEKMRIPFSIRRTFGQGVEAACGQLSAKYGQKINN